ncbi:hypothetical protein [Halegenticoccus tardaugens]|uniref:hypothetical protein n=1 Tax=Halegenticoccus tardaugens TaxID=2071624 RepID=UPI002B267685|nr:hypothetical protein [Halegenticoccus tardaugens]
MHALRRLVEEQPREFEPILDEFTAFLTDDERSIRLTTAKLFVTVAEVDPDAVVSSIPELAARLADEEEFYYVRARSAEALGYVALERPREVGSPGVLADLRIGLSFDEPEVKEKLAKALEYVALGDPDRLRHQVSNLAEHLADENELVRYHLCTTLVVIGCEYPAKLADVSDAIAARLADENPYVRGRAAEALGLLLRSGPDDATVSADDMSDADEEESFVADRLRFARNAFAEESPEALRPDEIGTIDAIRGTTDEVVTEITSPGGDGDCPHCGLSLPENGPPMCPRCGAPY